jgi:hypothetical protein
LLTAFLLSANFNDSHCKIYAYRLISGFRLVFFITEYNYTLTVRYRTAPVLKANTFFENLSNYSASYSVGINSGTFIAEMIIWQEELMMIVKIFYRN